MHNLQSYINPWFTNKGNSPVLNRLVLLDATISHYPTNSSNYITIKTLFSQIFGLVIFIEQKENDNNDNLCKIHGGLYIALALMTINK